MCGLRQWSLYSTVAIQTIQPAQYRADKYVGFSNLLNSGAADFTGAVAGYWHCSTGHIAGSLVVHMFSSYLCGGSHVQTQPVQGLADGVIALSIRRACVGLCDRSPRPGPGFSARIIPWYTVRTGLRLFSLRPSWTLNMRCTWHVGGDEAHHVVVVGGGTTLRKQSASVGAC